MPDAPSRSIPRLLADARTGNRAAVDALVPLVYGELRSLARAQRRRFGGDETLNTTAVIHEAYLKLAARDDASWESEAHFLAIAARAMRQIVIDYARRQRAAKRGGRLTRVSLEDLRLAGRSIQLTTERAGALLALDDSLERLGRLNERQCRIVECRFFAGMTIDQTASALGVSAATVKRGWAMAQAWLYRDLRGSLEDGR